MLLTKVPWELLYQYFSTSGDLHGNSILVAAIIIDDSSVPNDKIEIIPIVDVRPHERSCTIWTGVMRKFDDGDRNPVGILSLRGELGHVGFGDTQTDRK